MVFVACGLNHKTAPLGVRERFALGASNDSSILHRFTEDLDIDEAAVLFTCNRTEIYCNTKDPEIIIPWISAEKDISINEVAPYFYSHTEEAGIKHLMRVGAGLDSMMLGEPQILGQIKRAYSDANQAGTIGNDLDSIFQYIFQACKKIRSTSGVGKNPISIAYAAAQLVGQMFANYADLNVFIIGSGDTSGLVAKYLHQSGTRNFMVTSRTQEKAERLAKELQGKTIPILNFSEHLAKADVVISATSCPLPFINKSMVSKALSMRGGKPMFFLDLAVPRDIESDITSTANVHLYNIDDLQNVVASGINERQKAAIVAEEMVNNEVSNYINWSNTKQANHVIHGYQQHMQQLSELELQRAMNKIANGKCPYEVLNEFSRRLTNKLTHFPKIGLRQIAAENQDSLQELINYFSKK